MPWSLTTDLEVGAVERAFEFDMTYSYPATGGLGEKEALIWPDETLWLSEGMTLGPPLLPSFP